MSKPAPMKFHSNTAAFKATYSDFKLIKTRGVISLCFEIPLEQADAALKVLGGMPNPGAEVWCAIARLAALSESPAKDDDAHRSWSQLAPSQQAGIWCNDEVFWDFLNERRISPRIVKNADGAAAAVREYCGVNSRSELTTMNQKWIALATHFPEWRRQQEFEERVG